MAQLESLSPGNELYDHVVKRMLETIMDHGNGIPLKDYKFIRVLKISNDTLKTRFEQKKVALEREMGSSPAIWEAFHGSPDARKIANDGFDVSFSKGGNMFGRGIYFAPHSSKANQYTFGKGKGTIKGCPEHGDKACKLCTRRILMCLCIMGKQFKPNAPIRDIPGGFHSVVADPRDNPLLAAHLKYPEYAILHGHQILPYVLIEYTISDVAPRHSVPRISIEDATRKMTETDDLLEHRLLFLVLGLFFPPALLFIPEYKNFFVPNNRNNNSNDRCAIS